jgi:arylsulfatase A-like enzyme
MIGRRLATCVLLFAWPLSAACAADPDRFNVLLVVTDDQRWDTVSALGNPEIRTPHLDALARRGMVFRNAYCMGSMIPAVCAPSRTMLMTGRSLWRIPNHTETTFNGPTLGSVFRAAGYQTLFIGKRNNSFIAGNEAFETFLYHDDPDVEARSRSSQFMADRTLEWFQRRGEAGDRRPFFVYLGPPVPHDPRVAPPAFAAMYDPSRLSLPRNFMPRHPFDNGELRVRDELLAAQPRTPEEMRRHLADYYAVITCLDDQLGRIVHALEEAGELARTIVVFTSDQGLAVGGCHGLMGKQNLYEHVKPPLIMAGPGIAAGESPALVYHFDLFPTLCELCGVACPDGLEGRSLVPLLEGRSERVRDWLFAAYRDCQRMVRDERWKLISYRVAGERYTQLFDLQSDPDELANLAEEPAFAGERARLEALLARARIEFGDPSPWD